MSEPLPTLIVGTAGHVDHGKTTLIRALTGVELDTLAEEQARGLTIALGFTPLRLGDRTLALVDAPGHASLVRTMIAGATGLDAALLVISAEEGVMPQTREHLAILELLGVRQGVVALTMMDRVDEALLALAEDEARDLLAGTGLADAQIVPCSGLTGEGMEALRTALAGLQARERPADGPLRIPVDRAFTQHGFGTVITGTVWSGTLSVGERIRFLPGDLRGRVRALQRHGEEVQTLRAGWRGAVNVADVAAEAIAQGSTLVRAELPVTSILDLWYRHLPSGPPLPYGAEVRVLLGTRAVTGHAFPTGPGDAATGGTEVPMQVRLREPMVALPGDRVILRRPSPALTLGGGVVLDPWAPRLRSREAHAAQLTRLRRGDHRVFLERAGEQGLLPAQWQLLGGRPDQATALGRRVYAQGTVARLQGLVLDQLLALHLAHPLALGFPPRSLRTPRTAHLPDDALDAMVEALIRAGAAALRGELLQLAGHEVQLSGAQQALRNLLLTRAREAGIEGVTRHDLSSLSPDQDLPAIAHLCERQGELTPIPDLGWVSREVPAQIVAAVRGWFADHRTMSLAEFKAATGLTRRPLIAWLEWLDHARWTVRSGDVREPGPGLRGKAAPESLEATSGGKRAARQP
ncbi:MAG: selenocysteine-specific translation elongation factor [Deltaproteobacteria bacterium]|nr:selenocysteine-specific translation elongation factor [Deltaproteobacteria bacterium]